jgi:hypothetical protein
LSAAALSVVMARRRVALTSTPGRPRPPAGDTRGQRIGASVQPVSGAGQPSLVRVYLGKDLSGTTEPASTTFDPFGTATLNGVFVG